jgi:hypothetical protein
MDAELVSKAWCASASAFFLKVLPSAAIHTCSTAVSKLANFIVSTAPSALIIANVALGRQGRSTSEISQGLAV